MMKITAYFAATLWALSAFAQSAPVVSFSNITQDGATVSWADCTWQTSGARTWRMAVDSVEIVPEYTTIAPELLTGFGPERTVSVQVACVDDPVPTSTTDTIRVYYGDRATFTTLPDVVAGPTATPAVGTCVGETGLTSADDDRLLLCEPFDSATWYNDHGYVDGQSPNPSPVNAGTQLNRVAIVNSAECLVGSCLEGDWPVGVERTLAIVWPVKAANAADNTFVAEPDELYFRWYFKVDSNWNADQISGTEGNGKLFGFADGRESGDPGGQCGNGGATPDGTDCWSTRGLFWKAEDKDGGDASFAPDSTDGGVAGALARIGNYIYATGNGGETTGANGQGDGFGENQTRGGNGESETTCRRSGPPGTAEHVAACYGTPYDNFYAGIGSGDNIIVADTWYAIEQRVRMNDVGSDNGILETWVNGVKVYSKSNMRYRIAGNDNLHVRTVWLDLYKGGVSGNTVAAKSWVDQMVVSTEYIGPIPGLGSNPVDNIAPGTWYEVANSNLDALNPCPADNCVYSGNSGFEMIMKAWSGGAFDTLRNRLLIKGGGHGDYWGNEVYAFNVDDLTWSAVTTPSLTAPDAANEAATGLLPDGTPRSRHTYSSLEYSPSQDSLLAVGAQGTSPASISGDSLTHRLTLSGTPAWTTLADVTANGGRIGSITRDPDSGTIWYQASAAGGIAKYEPGTNAWTAYTGAAMNIYSSAAYDSTRDQILVIGGSSPNAWMVDVSGATPAYTNLNNESAFTSSDTDNIDGIDGPGVAYSPTRDKFVVWSGGADIWTVDPVTYAVARVTPAAGNTITPTAAEPLGTYGRFRYVPSKDVFIAVNATNENVYFYRMAP